MAAVYVLYHFGRNFPDGYCLDQTEDRLGRGERHFAHAEDFLVRLEEDNWSFFEGLWERARDAVPLPTSPSTEGSQLLGPLPERDKILRISRFLLAIETEEYLEEQDLESSIWAPYRHWGSTLNASDSIITFNYDTVVERLKGMVNLAGIDEDLRKPTPLLCKVHGSVDWDMQDDGSVVKKNFRTIMDRSKAGPHIGVPGKSKDSFGDAPAWHRAEHALEHADEVFILGYSLPPSDAASRELLLTSLAANKQPNLKVTLVLGDDQRASHRLESMLEYALEGRTNSTRITDTRLFVEDFMDAYSLRVQGGARR